MTRQVLSAAALFASISIAGCAGTATETSEARAPRVPVFEVDPSWPKVPEKWRIGSPSSIAIDAQDNVYLLHRPGTLKPDQSAMAAPAILVFDAAGNFIRAWGGPGAGYEWPEQEHGIHVDYKGYVWVGGNSCPALTAAGRKPVADDQLVKFTPTGKLVMQIGRSSQSQGAADSRNLHRPADAWVHPKTNEVFVADGYGNQRVVVFDADTGAFKRMWGAFGNKPTEQSPCAPNKPRVIPEGPGPQSFSTVHAVRVANDGMVYIADRENQRVQVFTNDGRFVNQFVRRNAPFARNLALSPDPAQRFLYVGGGNDIVVLDRKTLEIVDLIGGKDFITPHHIATDSKGNLYIAATTRGMQKLLFKGLAPAPAK